MPVKPVWPTEPGGKNGAHTVAYCEVMSQPSARVPRPSEERVHISSTVDAFRMRWPSSVPPLTSMRVMRETSLDVENIPA